MKHYFTENGGAIVPYFSVYAVLDTVSPVGVNTVYQAPRRIDGTFYVGLDMQTIEMKDENLSWLEHYLFWKEKMEEPVYSSWNWMQGAQPRLMNMSHNDPGGYKLLIYPHLVLLVKGMKEYRDAGTDLEEINVLVCTMRIPGIETGNTIVSPSRDEIWINDELLLGPQPWKQGPSPSYAINRAVVDIREKHHLVRKSTEEMNAILFEVEVGSGVTTFDSIEESNRFKLDAIKEYVASP